MNTKNRKWSLVAAALASSLLLAAAAWANAPVEGRGLLSKRDAVTRTLTIEEWKVKVPVEAVIKNEDGVRLTFGSIPDPSDEPVEIEFKGTQLGTGVTATEVKVMSAPM